MEVKAQFSHRERPLSWQMGLRRRGVLVLRTGYDACFFFGWLYMAGEVLVPQTFEIRQITIAKCLQSR